MILCKKCKRIWPAGTVWCGSCRATLGCRQCPDGHKNDLSSRCCTVCGSAKLSRGVQSLNLRGCSWIAVLAVLAVTIPPAICFLAGQAEAALRSLINTVVPILVMAGFISIMASLVFGQKAAKAICELWLKLVKLPIEIASAVILGIVHLMKRS